MLPVAMATQAQWLMKSTMSLLSTTKRHLQVRESAMCTKRPCLLAHTNSYATVFCLLVLCLKQWASNSVLYAITPLVLWLSSHLPLLFPYPASSTSSLPPPPPLPLLLCIYVPLPLHLPCPSSLPPPPASSSSPPPTSPSLSSYLFPPLLFTTHPPPSPPPSVGVIQCLLTQLELVRQGQYISP